MKSIRNLIVLCSVLAASSAAFADSTIMEINSQLKSQIQEALPQLQGEFGVASDVSVRSNPPPPPTPIREAKFKARVLKYTWTQQPDGTYQHVKSDVCLKDGTFNVYQFAYGQGFMLGQDDAKRFSCPVTVDGKSLEIWVGGIIAETQAPILDDTTLIPIKMAFGFYSLFGSSIGKDISQSEFNMAITKDLNLSSYILALQPMIQTHCTVVSPSPNDPKDPSKTPPPSCSTNYKEYFTVLVDLED